MTCIISNCLNSCATDVLKMAKTCLLFKSLNSQDAYHLGFFEYSFACDGDNQGHQQQFSKCITKYLYAHSLFKKQIMSNPKFQNIICHLQTLQTILSGACKKVFEKVSKLWSLQNIPTSTSSQIERGVSRLASKFSNLTITNVRKLTI